MYNIFKIKLSVILFAVLSITVYAAENGSFYKVANTIGVRGTRGLASVVTMPRTTFKYTPGKTKNGVMDDLTLVDYAISQDNSTVALAESIEQQDGIFLNRLLFLENSSYRMINGLEYKSKEKIQKIFFFAGNLFCIVKGERVMLRELYLTRNLRFAPKAVILNDEIASICYDKKYFYLKDNGSNLLQFNENMDKISELATRHKGGVIMLQPGTDKLIHFTSENVEYIQRSDSGLFKSSFRDLQNIPTPKKAWHAHNKRSIYFVSNNNTLHELVDMAYCDNADTSPFKDIIYNPYRREFFILANKRNMIEIMRPQDFQVRRKLSHHTMRPETNQNIKFMIPHPAGVFLITQEGEFTFIREIKRRFRKTVYNY